MTTVLIVIHLMAVLALIGLVLLQRSEGGALGISGGSGNFMSGRGAGNVLTRSTAVLAGLFFLTSIGLTILARIESRPSDILDRLPAQTAPAGGPPAVPGAPAGGSGGVLDILRQQSGGAGAPPAPPIAGADAPAPTAPAAEQAPPPPVDQPAAGPQAPPAADPMAPAGAPDPAAPAVPQPVPAPPPGG